MQLSARRLNRATLARQLLLAREPVGVVEAAHRVTAMQAQEPASPYIGLWSRVAGFRGADLDRALADGSIVKSTAMRVTLHAVDAADYAAFHEGMISTLRAARLHDRRYRSTGFTPADADAMMPDVLAQLATPHTNQEAEAWLTERHDGRPMAWLWWALRQYGPFLHAPTGGPWGFGARPSFAGAPPALRRSPEGHAVGTLLRRYLEGFGPATIADFRTFALLTSPVANEGRAAIAGRLVIYHGPGGIELLDVADGLLPDEDVPAPPRLLPMWDSTLLAYKERSRILPEAYRRLVIRSNGDTLPALLVDGHVAGVWRTVDDGIEAWAFRELGDDAWAGLEAEASALRAFLAPRQPRVYARYARWFSALPADAEVRILGRSE